MKLDGLTNEPLHVVSRSIDTATGQTVEAGEIKDLFYPKPPKETKKEPEECRFPKV